MSEPGEHNEKSPDYPTSVEETLRRVYDSDKDAIRVFVVSEAGPATSTSTTTSTSTSTTAT